MENLKLPVFEMPPLPDRPVPLSLWQQLNAELVKRLKQAGEYDRLRHTPAHEPVSVPFRLPSDR